MKKLPAEQEKWISLHDKRITKIECHDDKVEFYFSKGFDLIEDGRLNEIESGIVRFSGCQEDDFFCRVIDERLSSYRLPKYRGKEITLQALNKMLVEKKKEIEIYIELYSDVFTYWRGVLVPHPSGRKRSPIVVIETMDFFPITYLWE